MYVVKYIATVPDVRTYKQNSTDSEMYKIKQMCTV